jgi:hypothetical protein
LPSWGEILEELQRTQPTGPAGPTGPPDFDAVRRKYLTELHTLTERATIVYATDWLMGGPPGISITPEDMVAMMEVCKDMGDGPLRRNAGHCPPAGSCTPLLCRPARAAIATLRATPRPCR